VRALHSVVVTGSGQSARHRSHLEQRLGLWHRHGYAGYANVVWRAILSCARYHNFYRYAAPSRYWNGLRMGVRRQWRGVPRHLASSHRALPRRLAVSSCIARPVSMSAGLS